jgi:hypothetical protein
MTDCSPFDTNDGSHAPVAASAARFGSRFSSSDVSGDSGYKGAGLTKGRELSRRSDLIDVEPARVGDPSVLAISVAFRL